jgi:hypothetical protein
MASSNLTYKESSHSDKEKKVSLELVKESFGDTDIAFDEYYNWQFLRNPVGRGTVLIAYDGDLPVGQVASIPCKYLMPNEKEPMIITLTMNVCVSPKYRGMGILTDLMDRIHKGGQHSSPFSIGVPNNQSMKGHQKNKYYPLPMTLLVRPVILSNYFSNPLIQRVFKPFDTLWRKGVNVERQEYSNRFDKRFDSLTDLHQQAIRQVRNSDFLNWRYKDNPRRKYKVFATIDSNEDIQGYLVASITEVFGKRLGLIVDFVVKNDSVSVKKLVLNALRYFWENKVTFAAAACFPNCIEYNLLKQGGFFVSPKRFRPHPLAVCVKILSESWIKQNVLLDRNNWFFMLGDYETF